MLYFKHRTAVLLSMGGGVVVYALLLTLSMDVVEIIWYNTPFL